MNRKLCVFAAASIAMMINGCATIHSTSHCISFGYDKSICLLPPEMLPKIVGAHMITIEHNGKKKMFIGLLRIDSRAIRLNGSSLLGPDLFTVTYNGHSLNSTPPNMLNRPGILIAMLELVVANPHILRGALQGMVLRQTFPGKSEQVRNLYTRKRLFMHIAIYGDQLSHASVRMDIPSAHLIVLMQPLSLSTKQ